MKVFNTVNTVLDSTANVVVVSSEAVVGFAKAAKTLSITADELARNWSAEVLLESMADTQELVDKANDEHISRINELLGTSYEKKNS